MTPPRLLLVEDHAPLRTQLAGLLRGAGYRVDEASDGRLALQQVLSEPPDALVLDLGLPGLDGLALCQRLRAQASAAVPVLMLTARDALPDRLAGFAAGTDDYLVKPFEPAELLARVAALLRRPQLGQDYLLRIGSLTLDRRACEATRQGRRLVLAPIPFALLRALAEAYPRALTRSTLIHQLWDDEPPDSDPLRSHFYLLRQQLDKPFDRPMLRTVHGIGYRLESDACADD